jgi:hypothetical protein
VVAAGSCVTLTDEFGHSTRVVIDPDNVGELAKREGYAASATPQAAALMGAAVGQEVDLPALAFGDTHRYTVTGIESAYRRMLQVVHDRANTLGGLPHMKMVHVGMTGDAARDLAHMKAEVMRSSDISRRLFEAYGTGHMTLSGFAKRQGRSPVEAVLGWPTEGPPLFVGTGIETERVAALELLTRPDAVFVIDALTLAEFVNLGVQEALGHVPNLLVSPVSKAKLEELLREAEVDRSIATSTEVNGELALIEHDSRYHERRVEFFKSVLAAIERYCEIRPAYGELEAEGEVPRLAEVLQDEEMEVLLLAKAAGAAVLTLDGRFRFVLEIVAKVPGIWPQALLMHCTSGQLLSPMKLASATVRQFLLNRSFVSLSSGDLTWMVLQGGVYLQHGMRRFKAYLSSDETEFASVVTVAFEFLQQIAALQIHLGAFGELFEHVLEAAMRHRQCPPDFDKMVTQFAVDLTGTVNESAHLYGKANLISSQRVQMQQRHLAERYIRARQRANLPAVARPVAVRVLFCSAIPWVVEDKSSPKIKPATEVLLPSRLPEQRELEAATTNDKPTGDNAPPQVFLVAPPELPKASASA